MTQPDMRLVPVEPTDAMLDAARGLVMALSFGAPNHQTSLSEVARSGFYGELWSHILTDEDRAMSGPITKAHRAQLIYRAMLAAAPHHPQPAAREAAQRVQAYLARHAKNRHGDRVAVHGYDVGAPSESVLLVADLKALSAGPEEAPEGAVAWRYRHFGDKPWQVTQDHSQAHDYTSEVQPLYTHPAPTQQPADDKLREAVEALEPLARLELPKKPVGNAGAYSILHTDIRRAKEALAALKTEAAS